MESAQLLFVDKLETYEKDLALKKDSLLKLRPQAPIEKKFYSILRLQSLVACVMYNGFEYEYKIANKDGRKFLDSIKDIAGDDLRLKEVHSQLGKSLPDVNSILKLY